MRPRAPFDPAKERDRERRRRYMANRREQARPKGACLICLKSPAKPACVVCVGCLADKSERQDEARAAARGGVR